LRFLFNLSENADATLGHLLQTLGHLLQTLGQFVLKTPKCRGGDPS